jgi:heme/copper-type cytochrome/quinol oxidase subunit 2
MERCGLLQCAARWCNNSVKDSAMMSGNIINMLGYIAIGALALTLLFPLITAMIKCRKEKRERKINAQNTGHSLS